MRMRNRFTTLLTIPLVVFFWAIGWSLSWIGSEKRKGEANKKPDHKQLAFAVLVPEQKYATQDLPDG